MKKSRKSASNSRRRGRAGGLLWWTFRDTASRPEKLAACALKTKLPPIFLPVPFPVEPREAFRRALQRATVKVPTDVGGTWRADRMAELPDADGPVREWAEKLEAVNGLEFGIVESWHPRATGGPWLVRIWIALDPSTKVLHMLPASGMSRRSVKDMMARVKSMFKEELQNATAPEIGEGVLGALRQARGVKLRAGLWSVPGEQGIKLVRSLNEYLLDVGNSDAGMLILLQDRRSDESGAGSLVEMGLVEGVAKLIAEIDGTKLKEVGTGKLRTLWDKVQNMHKKFQANEELIGRRAANNLRAKLKPAEGSLREAASAKKVTLNRSAGPAASTQLANGIRAVRDSARKRDVAGLAAAESLLVRGQAAAWTAGIPYLVARLRKLTKAAIEVNKSIYFDALESAAIYVEKQAQHHLPFSEQTSNGTKRRKRTI
jgi:hypothetical protein